MRMWAFFSKTSHVFFFSILLLYKDLRAFLSDTNYFEFAFLFMPHPEDIDPASRVRDYINKEDFPVQTNRKEKGVPMTGGFVPLCHNIVGANESIDFSMQEIKSIIERIKEWWDADKRYLKTKTDSIRDDDILHEFQGRFSGMVEVLSHVVIPKLSLNNSNAKQLKILRSLMNEIEEYNLPDSNIKVAWLQVDSSTKKDVLSKIRASFAVPSDKIIRNSLESVLLMQKIDRKIMTIEDLSYILEAIAQKVYWRHQTYLAHTLLYLQIIARRNYSSFTPEIEKLLLDGLAVLSKETMYDSQVFEFSESISIRLHATGLARIIYNQFLKRNEVIPEALVLWKEIAESGDEFVEIRNKWKNLTYVIN